MSKCLLAIGILTVSIPAFGVTVGVTGQSQTGTKYPSVIKAPYNQVTDLGGSTVRLETGNKNRLINAGFEHSTFSTGWTTAVTGTATITAAVETTSPLEGKKSGKYTCAGGASGGTCTIYQDVTTAHTPQGAAALYVKSDTVWNSLNSTGVQVYSRKDGANFQAKAVDVTSDKLFSIPVTLSNVTSTGVAAVITVAASQTIIVFLDEGYVGAADLKQDFSPVGPMISYGPMTIKGTTTDPTKATTREKDDVSCRVNGQFYECTYEYRAASATGAAVGSGGYIFNLPSGVAIDTNYQYTTTNRATFSAYDGLKAAASIGFGDIEYTGNGDTGGKCDVFATSSTTFQSDCFFGGTSVWMVSSSEAPVINQANAGMKFQIRFRGAGLSSNYSAYSTTNADYGFSPCALTGSWVTNATYTALCKRSGEMLRVKGKVAVTGAPTAAALTLTIPNSLTIDANKIPAADKEILGHGGYVVSGVNSYRAGAYYNSSTTVAIETLPASSAQNHVQAAVSNTSPFTFASGDYVSFDFEVPVSGWDQTSVVIGQFNGLESCADSYQCEGTYSAKVVASTGGVSDENLDWIAGNCTTANPSVCTFKTGLFTTTPNCTATMVIAASGQIASIDAQSATSVSVRQSQSAGLSANPFNLVCQKAGVDAVFKTARAVASDKNIQSIGSTGVDTQVVHFGGGADCGTVCSTGNCTICNQTGTKITSVSWIATGEYNLNGIDGTKYSCTGSAETSQYSGLIHKRNLSSSTFAKMRTGTTSTANGASATAICIGTP